MNGKGSCPSEHFPQFSGNQHRADPNPCRWYRLRPARPIRHNCAGWGKQFAGRCATFGDQMPAQPVAWGRILGLNIQVEIAAPVGSRPPFDSPGECCRRHQCTDAKLFGSQFLTRSNTGRGCLAVDRGSRGVKIANHRHGKTLATGQFVAARSGLQSPPARPVRPLRGNQPHPERFKSSGGDPAHHPLQKADLRTFQSKGPIRFAAGPTDTSGHRPRGGRSVIAPASARAR